MKTLSLWLIGLLFIVMGMSSVQAAPDDLDHQVAVAVDKARAGDSSYVYPLIQKKATGFFLHSQNTL